MGEFNKLKISVLKRHQKWFLSFNYIISLKGFTDAIDGTSEVLIATGYDVDADCGQMNIYRARTDQIPQYMATLADNQTDRYIWRLSWTYRKKIDIKVVIDNDIGNF